MLCASVCIHSITFELHGCLSHIGQNLNPNCKWPPLIFLLLQIFMLIGKQLVLSFSSFIPLQTLLHWVQWLFLQWDLPYLKQSVIPNNRYHFGHLKQWIHSCCYTLPLQCCTELTNTRFCLYPQENLSPPMLHFSNVDKGKAFYHYIYGFLDVKIMKEILWS